MYIIVISGIAFFHFLIDHTMMDIEAWVFDKSWPIFLMIKLVALFGVYLFVSVKLPAGENFLTIIHDSTRNFRTLLAGILSLVLIIMVAVKPQFVDGKIILFSKVLTSFLCALIIFTIDSLVVMLIEKINPQRPTLRYIHILAYSVSLTILNYFSFKSQIEYLPFLFLVHYFNIFLVIIKSSTVSMLFFNLFFTAPMISMIGLDPIWGSSFSILEPEKRLNWFAVSSFITLLSFYWVSMGKKNQLDSLSTPHEI